MAKKCVLAFGIYITTAIVITCFLRWYKFHTSPWRQITSAQWEQVAAQMRAGKRPSPLDAKMVLADVDAWLKR